MSSRKSRSRSPHRSRGGAGAGADAEPELDYSSRSAEVGLAAACERGDVEEAQFLLHAGIAPDVRFEFGMTPLMKASARGHLALMNVLLNSGVREGTVKLKTKVRNAAEVNLKSDGHYDAVRLLLTHGAIVDIRAKDGETPLMRAAFNGHVGCVDLLLASGADVDAKSAQHGNTALIVAASRLHRTVVLRLLSSRADVNAATKFDDTSLMRAAYRGNLDIVKILVEGGADPDAVNTVTWTARGKKALDIARQKGFKDIEEYLFPITEPRGKLLVSIQRPPRPYNVM